MPLTGDGRSGQRPENSPKRFASWLGGTSATPVEGAASPDTTPKSKRGASPLDTTPKSATQSRFGFLASSMSAFTTRLTNQPPTPRQVDDELCNMDIEAALFPSSSPSDHDSFSPAAYMNLQMNAAGLLHKMQDAYRERTVAMQEVQAEREAQREETEETELRIRHCKNQLEQMAAKAVEQEHAMQQLMAELQAEKRARHEEQRMSRDSRIMGEGSTITEDLGVDEEERKRWRTSDGTVMSELSIDTDRESAESESIFSRSRSPTAMTSATDSEGLDSSPAGPQQPRAPMLQVPRSKSTQRMTAFQKLVKNISGEAGDNMGSDGCRNCRGQDSSVAWDTVSLLRDENRGLKQRVAQLEITVDGALDVVNGIGLL
ncbi:Uu.00g081970.m01.CDS01 [Anthostomella pinea]|uniref:Uu.00g081970.m01.CDS01 n=1 Tax=Anthostomella pinea TaxID=933095 RepID=A0AAI8VL91_9PEZI|nr:Uu.00g081970.m01.CDS01 [Anthostomella pinea]